MTTPGDDTEPILVIAGLRARPLREWRDQLAPPVLLMAFAAMEWSSALQRWSTACVAIVLLAHFVYKLSRGQIALRPDRLTIRAWNDSFVSRTLELDLRTIRKIALHGPRLHIGYFRHGKPQHLKISVLAPVAEDLYDQMLLLMEELPELAGRIEEKSERRFVIAPPAERPVDGL